MAGPAKARIARDQRGERTAFEEIEVGADLGSREWIVTEEMIDHHCEIDEDYHEWFSVDSPFGGRIAPPLISYPPARFLIATKYNIRGLLTAYECEHFNPIRPNKKMIVTGQVVDKFTKREREYFTIEAECVDEDGLKIFRTRRTHLLDVISRTAPREGLGLDSGIPKEQ